MLTRRQFAFVTGSVFLAGCRPRKSALVSSADRKRIVEENAERTKHLEYLQQFKVPVSARRTSQPLSQDVLAICPELRTRLKQTIRLHPRFADEPSANESHFGGSFLWPQGEAWPTCEKYRIPLVPVLQLKKADAPNNFAFFEDSDLLQLLWSARDHDHGGPNPRLYWRKESTATKVSEMPNTDDSFPSYVPIACRVFPERLLEFPNWSAIPPSAATRGQIEKWKGRDFYDQNRTTALGCKVGGYPSWKGDDRTPSCDTCKWGMEYLLTISDDDWGGTAQGAPIEETPAKSVEPGYSKALGLKLPGGVLNLFVCRRCKTWPVKCVSG